MPKENTQFQIIFKTHQNLWTILVGTGTYPLHDSGYQLI